MSLPGWPHAESPFHAGEQAAQARAGVRERMEEIGRRMLRAEMPQQHRDFFPQLPFLALGAVDNAGRLQATLLAGAPGFVRAPDASTLAIDALPPAGDPLHGALRVGAAVGLLGIELPTRRRNRANGWVASADARGLRLQVTQSFGNCPKYIQRREPLPRGDEPPHAPRALSAFDAASLALLGRADTFFVASRAGGAMPSAGVDVSHRGGRPGFLRLDAAAMELSWPDYAGNNLFNTIGNLLANPEAALVVPDFESGDLLHLSGRAEVIWDKPEVEARHQAQRLIRLRVETLLWRARALPLRWRFTD